MSSEKIKIPIALTQQEQAVKLLCLKKLFQKRWMITKWIIFITIIVATVINTYNGFALPHGEVECFEDYLFNETKALYKFLLINKYLRNTLLITSSLGIDLIVFTGFLYWVWFSDSWRLIISLALFYSFRGINQQLFAMGFPKEYLWEYPGFPSLFVSYLKTRDFFFSGHVGMPILLGLEWNRNKKYYFQYVSWFICALEFFTMIVLRGHYSIDLISGIIFSHYFFLIGESYAKSIDNCKKETSARMMTLDGETTIDDDHNHV